MVTTHAARATDIRANSARRTGRRWCVDSREETFVTVETLRSPYYRTEPMEIELGAYSDGMDAREHHEPRLLCLTSGTHPIEINHRG